MLFRSVPGWAEILDLPTQEAVTALRNPAVRDRLRTSAEQSGSTLAAIVADLSWPIPHSAASSPAAGDGWGAGAGQLRRCVRRALRPLGGRRPPKPGYGPSPWPTAQPVGSPGSIPCATQGSSSVPRTPEPMSKMLSTFDYAVVLLALARERGTLQPARSGEQVDRHPGSPLRPGGSGSSGRGSMADLVVFDPDTVGPGAPGWRNDLPTGAGGSTTKPTGIDHVVVNGIEIVGPQGLTGERPGPSSFEVGPTPSEWFLLLGGCRTTGRSSRVRLRPVARFHKAHPHLPAGRHPSRSAPNPRPAKEWPRSHPAAP